MNKQVLPILFLLFTGCVIGSNKYPRPSDLSPSWLVDRTRILGIQANPPEARIGETVSFEVLLPDPEQHVDLVAWLACNAEESSDFGCPLAGEDLLSGDGLIGLQPVYEPTYTVPEDALLQDERAYMLIQVLALPDSSTDEEGQEELDFNEIEAGFKRLVVSSATSTNANPVVQDFLFNAVATTDGEAIEVTAGTSNEWTLNLSEDSIETYTHINQSGETEERVEEPFALWYTSSGTLLESVTLYPYFTADWLAPEEVGYEGSFWVVIRDRRGGLSWIERTFIVH